MVSSTRASARRGRNVNASGVRKNIIDPYRPLKPTLMYKMMFVSFRSYHFNFKCIFSMNAIRSAFILWIVAVIGVSGTQSHCSSKHGGVGCPRTRPARRRGRTCIYSARQELPAHDVVSVSVVGPDRREKYRRRRDHRRDISRRQSPSFSGFRSMARCLRHDPEFYSAVFGNSFLDIT